MSETRVAYHSSSVESVVGTAGSWRRGVLRRDTCCSMLLLGDSHGWADSNDENVSLDLSIIVESSGSRTPDIVDTERALNGGGGTRRRLLLLLLLLPPFFSLAILCFSFEEDLLRLCIAENDGLLFPFEECFLLLDGIKAQLNALYSICSFDGSLILPHQ